MSASESLDLLEEPKHLFMDPIHGGVHLFDHERAVIDQMLFQRLRHIAQTDVLFLVFTGARHSRFGHSIGAMHVAGRLFKAATRSYLPESKGTLTKAAFAARNEAIRYFLYVVRLAALLHDTGHSPFSHQFEHSRPVAALLKRPDVFDSLWAGLDWSLYYKARPTALTHEHYSVRISHELLYAKHAELPVAPQDVIAVLETSDATPSDRFRAHAATLFESYVSRQGDDDASTKVQGFLREIITGELDVDKMDYLLRDSFYTGSHYGFYNLDHLLNTIRLAFDPSLNNSRVSEFH